MYVDAASIATVFAVGVYPCKLVGSWAYSGVKGADGHRVLFSPRLNRHHLFPTCGLALLAHNLPVATKSFKKSLKQTIAYITP